MLNTKRGQIFGGAAALEKATAIESTERDMEGWRRGNLVEMEGCRTATPVWKKSMNITVRGRWNVNQLIMKCQLH